MFTGLIVEYVQRALRDGICTEVCGTHVHINKWCVDLGIVPWELVQGVSKHSGSSISALHCLVGKALRDFYMDGSVSVVLRFEQAYELHLDLSESRLDIYTDGNQVFTIGPYSEGHGLLWACESASTPVKEF